MHVAEIQEAYLTGSGGQAIEVACLRKVCSYLSLLNLGVEDANLRAFSQKSCADVDGGRLARIRGVCL
jgi:hypothetical protein